MTEKLSADKVPAPMGHVVYERLTPCESRVLSAPRQDGKTGEMPSGK